MADQMCPGCADDNNSINCANCGIGINEQTPLIDGQYCSMECMMQAQNSGTGKIAENKQIGDPGLLVGESVRNINNRRNLPGWNEDYPNTID